MSSKGDSSKIPSVLTIAGSDSGGGAGIQGDIKTLTALKVYSGSVITAITAQNTQGVRKINILDVDIIASQLESVLSDIEFSAIKTGMLPSVEIIRVTGEKVREYGVGNLVVDPVLVATSGDTLVKGEAIQEMKKVLFPLAKVITPNIPEAERISELKIRSISDARAACERMGKLGCEYVLLKGGHVVNDDEDVMADGYDEDMAIDLLYEVGSKRFQAFGRPRIYKGGCHGTGCSLSSGIAAGLARGLTVCEAVDWAKEFVYRGIESGFGVGKGCFPLNHMHSIDEFDGTRMVGEK